MLPIDGVEAVYVARDSVQDGVLVQVVEAIHVAHEVVNVKQPSELIPLRLPNEVAVLRQFDALCNASLDDFDVGIGLGYKVHCAIFETVNLCILVHRQNDNRNRCELLAHLHLHEHFSTVHVWHKQVKKYEVDLILMALEDLHRFHAISCIVHVVVFHQKIAQYLAIALHIVGN